MSVVTLEEGLFAFLTADTNVTGLIGTNIFPDAAPANQVAPYVVYHRTSTQDEQTLAGSIDQPTAEMEFEIYGTSRANCAAIERAIRNSQGGGSGLRLKEFFGNLGGVTVQGTWMDSEAGAYVQTVDNSGRPAQTTSLSFRITYLEQQ